MYRYFLEKLGVEHKSQPTDRDILTTFLLELHLKYNLKCVGRKFLFSYLSYQFLWYSTSRTVYGKYSVKNIFGKSSLDRFLDDKRRKELQFLHRIFVNDNKIKLSEIFSETQPLKIESLDRARFHNTPAGFNFCLETTTLYDKSCRECMTCTYSLRCKQAKEKIYVR